jgi:hypothetical protein
MSMDEFQRQETVVDAPVDAGQTQVNQDPMPAGTGETVVTPAVDAPKPDANVGEAIRKEVERREAQLKKQYEEKYSPISQHSAYLERRARQEGFQNVEEYLRAIDELEQRMQVEQESQRMGVDPNVYQQYFAPVNQKLQQYEQELQSFRQEKQLREQQEQATSKWGALYEQFPGLLESAKAFNEGKNPDWYNETMQAYVNRGYDPADAYRLAHADTIARQQEQQVLARLTGRDDRQVLPSTDSPNNAQFDPANMTDAQIQELSERARRGERIIF